MCLFHQLFSNVRHGLDSGFPVLWRIWKSGLVVETVGIYSLPRVSHTCEPDHAGGLGRETFHSVPPAPLIN